MISIILADDHTIVRQGVRTLLESDPELQVTGEASDGLQAIARWWNGSSRTCWCST